MLGFVNFFPSGFGVCVRTAVSPQRLLSLDAVRMRSSATCSQPLALLRGAPEVVFLADEHIFQQLKAKRSQIRFGVARRALESGSSKVPEVQVPGWSGAGGVW